MSHLKTRATISYSMIISKHYISDNVFKPAFTHIPVQLNNLYQYQTVVIEFQNGIMANPIIF